MHSTPLKSQFYCQSCKSTYRYPTEVYKYGSNIDKSAYQYVRYTLSRWLSNDCNMYQKDLPIPVSDNIDVLDWLPYKMCNAIDIAQ